MNLSLGLALATTRTRPETPETSPAVELVNETSAYLVDENGFYLGTEA